VFGHFQGGTLHRRKAQMVARADVPVDTEHQITLILAADPLAKQHGIQVGPIGEFSGVRPLPGMAVHQVIENMSRYEL
jgi:hypothetical protein